MKRLIILAACMLLLLPALWPERPVRARDGEPEAERGLELPEPLGLGAIASEPLRMLDRARTPQVQHQVRIEQRVVVRIGPSSAGGQNRAMADLSRQPISAQFEEVAHGDCVAVEDVAAVQPTADNRLLLVMQDRRLLTASLERNCAARAFYSGFYVERNADGRLCVARDRLQSRAGASCEVASFARLVAIRD